MVAQAVRGHNLAHHHSRQERSQLGCLRKYFGTRSSTILANVMRMGMGLASTACSQAVCMYVCIHSSREHSSPPQAGAGTGYRPGIAGSHAG